MHIYIFSFPQILYVIAESSTQFKIRQVGLTLIF